MALVPGLFDQDLPPGFQYRDAFISEADEAALLDEIANIAFSTFEMRGVVARRRVAFYGQSYDRESAGPLPDFLFPLRESLAAWAGVPADAFAMALVNEYQPGAPIGWHRDAPQYDIIAGVSLLSACRMSLRPYVSPGNATSSSSPRSSPRRATHHIMLERRSAYLMAGDARTSYEHHIPPARELRYSITFRTLRASRRPRSGSLK